MEYYYTIIVLLVSLVILLITLGSKSNSNSECLANSSGVDCVMGDWGKCDINTQMQKRSVKIHKFGKGKDCGVLTQKCTTDRLNLGSMITAGTNIYPGQYMRSSTGNRTLYLKPNGDLWLLHDMPTGTGDNVSGNYYWTSRSNGNNGPCYLGFQSDGNLVIYDSGGGVSWSSGSAGKGGVALYMQDDGNLVMYTASGGVAWSADMTRKTQDNFSTDVNAPTSIEINGKCLDASLTNAQNPTGKGYGLNDCNESLDQRFYIDTYSGHAYVLKSSSGKSFNADNNGDGSHPGYNWYWGSINPDDSQQNQWGKASGGNMLGFGYQGSRCLDVGNTDLNWSCSPTNTNQQITWRQF
jgi:hypothetical protein